MIGVTHPVTAFYFDRAVHGVGATIEAEMEASTEDAKSTKAAYSATQKVLNKWLRTEGGGRYKDPAVSR